MSMICEVHRTEMKWKEAGVSKAGRSYPAFWSCPTKNADGSFCQYKPPKAVGGVATFTEDLDRSSAQATGIKKDQTITRLALAKSLIERGDKFSPDTVEEFKAWLSLVENRGLAAVPTIQRQPDGEPEVAVSDLPF